VVADVGEDVLVELPRLAITGSGIMLALELKTTEAVKNRVGLEYRIQGLTCDFRC
jgi:hypothetical protein